MKWTSLNELREKYLSFFESKDHLRLPSFSLVPNGDKSLLLINSGMAPMKKYFTGEVKPPHTRVTTCQKCIRTPDLERVGKTARHGTYFEMLGNFSFGDYFKDEAIAYSWEFLTKTLEIPENLLWPSIYEKDDESYDIWIKMGVPAEHIVRLGKADNFWEHGTGPCGPCSEIYFDRGLKYGCGSPDCKPGCDCDRFMEIWNNVFSQFDNDGKGNYTELAQKNIDTGMGLDRLACVMQGVDNMFEVDTTRKILDKVVEISGKKYGVDPDGDVSIRVVTDHVRSATFMICDGVVPSNEGRGYVLRRILRRASRHGKLLGIDRTFLTEVCDVVIAQNDTAYPELVEKADYIKKIILLEEERFNATIDSGLSILASIIAKAEESGTKVVAGEDVFKLYDTFGFPIDLTREIVEEKGLTIDEDKFTELMKEQRDRARAKRGSISGWSDASKSLFDNIPATDFVGYDSDRADAKIIAIFVGDETAESVNEGECTVIFDKTPFYGEGGGQVGDTGSVSADGVSIDVIDTKKIGGLYLHQCVVTDGKIKVGDTLTLTVDGARRAMIRRNHSAVHLLQAALRKVLGTHVEQSGSYVDSERLRFDFTHYAAMTPAELAAVEAEVNGYIMAGAPVNTVVTDIDTARREGAMALFGEKYGDTVRMVKMGDFSVELCGGTHASNTADMGVFKIVSESSVAAGIRRIEAVCSLGVLKLLSERDALIGDTAQVLKANNHADLPARATSLQAELAEKKREIDALNSKLASSQVDSLIANAADLGKVKLVAADLGDMSIDAVRTICDTVRDKLADAVAVFAVHSGEKLNFIAACSKSAVDAGAHAGNLLREVSAVTGGKGGGRPDSATSGGKDIAKIPEALAHAKTVLAGMLK